MRTYLVLLRVGFTVPRTIASRAVRSYRTLSPLPVNSQRKTIGGILSAALAVSSHYPDVIWHPALRSPDFPPPIKLPNLNRANPKVFSSTKHKTGDDHMAISARKDTLTIHGVKCLMKGHPASSRINSLN